MGEREGGGGERDSRLHDERGRVEGGREKTLEKERELRESADCTMIETGGEKEGGREIGEREREDCTLCRRLGLSRSHDIQTVPVELEP